MFALRRHPRASGLSGQKPRKVERTAGLGASSGKSAVAERLYPDGRSDHIPVDVNVARIDPFRNVYNGFFDPAVQTESQAVAEGIDAVDRSIQSLPLVSNDMQDRPEHLVRKLGRLRYLDERRRHKMPSAVSASV
jgi:hypothetical protein